MSGLKASTLKKNAILVVGELQAESFITEESPALSVMTDFRVVDAITVAHDTLLKDAHCLMLKRAIRLLFVRKNGEFVGIVTVRDLLGERPVLLEKKHDEIIVDEIKTPKEALVYLSLKSLEKANIRDLLSVLGKIKRRHTLVVDDTTAEQKVIGMISTSTVAQKMGKTLNTGRDTDLVLR